MDNEESQEAEPGHLRSSTNLSFRSSQCSLGDLTSDDFYELCKARLKISKKNTALLLKIK